jgi:GrpB-like predicted nucleotidyltransferase (UPF0157 family)
MPKPAGFVHKGCDEGGATGRVVSIHVASSARAPMTVLEAAELVQGRGIRGDRYFNGIGTFSKEVHEPDAELTLLELEEVDRFNRVAGTHIAPGAFRRNIVTSGVSLDELKGSYFYLGGAIMQGFGSCEPCRHLAELVHPAVLRVFAQRGGLRARVVWGGPLRPGDAIFARPGQSLDMPVYLVPPDPSWPEQFRAERDRIRACLGNAALGIEHIGSTAVPGLAAKPIIDVMVSIDSIGNAGVHIERLRALDYHYFPYAEDRWPERRWFMKPNPWARTHHLHLTEKGSRFEREHLAFRDVLRSEPKVAAEYDALKHDLAVRFPGDREAYTTGKSEFVERIVTRALG